MTATQKEVCTCCLTQDTLLRILVPGAAPMGEDTLFYLHAQENRHNLGYMAAAFVRRLLMGGLVKYGLGASTKIPQQLRQQWQR